MNNHLTSLSICKPYKVIRDSLHGYISLSMFAVKIIDNPKFQRLRKLKQLGTCNYVFPNAIHTRFEHSIGTYYLAGELLNNILTTHYEDDQNNDNIYKQYEQYEQYLSTITELSNYYHETYENKRHPLDSYVCELIKISALCHDLGHGPYSHVFDDVFIPKTNKKNHANSTHETRSGLILEQIIQADDVLNKIVKPNDIEFMKAVINPKPHHIGFVFQIVSNSITGLDVDKYDYIPRDIRMINFQAQFEYSRLIKNIKIIDNNIVYSEHSINDILNLFQTRHRLHREIYCHKAVISMQFMIVELLLILDKIMKFSNSLNDMNEFCKYTDEYIIDCVKILDTFRSNLTPDQIILLDGALEILKNIEYRKLYKFVDSGTTKKKINVSSIFDKYSDKSNFLIFQRKIGFVSGNKPNPFDSIYVYKTKDSKIVTKIETHKMLKNDITIMMPKFFQEFITMIFVKNNDFIDSQRISEIKHEFQTFLNNS